MQLTQFEPDGFTGSIILQSIDSAKPNSLLGGKLLTGCKVTAKGAKPKLELTALHLKPWLR